MLVDGFEALQLNGNRVIARDKVFEFIDPVLIGVGSQRRTFQRIAGKLHGDARHARGDVVLQGRYGSVKMDEGDVLGLLGWSLLCAGGKNGERVKERGGQG